MLPGTYGSLEAQLLRQRGVPLASKRPHVVLLVYLVLCIGSHGICGPLAKTRAYPTGETSSDRHNGALLAPSRGDPVENLFEYRVTRQRAPGSFDEQVTDPAGALAANMATSHRGPR
jgi:hypothetical protein